MNRSEHLKRSTKEVARHGFHDEHIVLDFGSSPPVNRSDLPSDRRLKLFRVEDLGVGWWLTHSYNLAFALSRCEYILKLDADVLLGRDFFSALSERLSEVSMDLMCSRLTLQDWKMQTHHFVTNGLFLANKKALCELGGFNPYLSGWGWDEIDLYSRFFLHGMSVSRLPTAGVAEIDHGDEERVEGDFGKRRNRGYFLSTKQVALGRKIQVQNERNKLVAVASIERNVRWPAFSDYRDAFVEVGTLPDLAPVAFFSPDEREEVIRALIGKYLGPSLSAKVLYRLMAVLRFGPYVGMHAERILAKNGIDLAKMF